MTDHYSVDIAIVGAGFGGSFTALILKQMGFRVLVLDRAKYPRFAIGESSTPIADLILRKLASRFNLPALLPLSRYGTWKQNCPELGCGRKRGFAFYEHLPGHHFQQLGQNANQLLVAASSSDSRSDTHWLRADVDFHFMNQLPKFDIPCFDQTEVKVQESRPHWKLSANRRGEKFLVEAKFLIDASGQGAFLPRHLNIPDVQTLTTHSRALFAHFDQLLPWQQILEHRNIDTTPYPFPCDASALHHLIPEGWMWQLRFDHGVTSAGFVLDATRHPLDESIAPEAEWNRLLTRYPDLQEQFAQSRIVAPESGLQRTGRLQHLSSQTAGENWALLPFTAGFIDPLYSTGIAHTMTGIDRLTHIIEQHWKQDSLSDELESYDRNLQREIHFLDRIIELSYRAMPRFELFVPTSMLYFAAATTYEQIHFNETNPTSAFLCADNIRLNECLAEISLKLNEALEQTADHHKSAETYFDTVARSISPFNSAGLCNPQVQNMYHYTAVDLPEL